MWRVLMMVSVVPPVILILLSWWHGSRVLAESGARRCRIDLAKGLPGVDETTGVRRSEETANLAGMRMWRFAMRDWRSRDPAAYASRQKSKRIASIVPPLTVVIATFAMVVGKLPPVGGIALVAASVAISSVLTILTLGPELRACADVATRLRKARMLPVRDDEDAVIGCLLAHAWRQTPPAVLRWLTGGK